VSISITPGLSPHAAVAAILLMLKTFSFGHHCHGYATYPHAALSGAACTHCDAHPLRSWHQDRTPGMSAVKGEVLCYKRWLLQAQAFQGL
jgi:hypothetical protein